MREGVKGVAVKHHWCNQCRHLLIVLNSVKKNPVGANLTQFMPMPILRFECGIGINWVDHPP